MMLVVREVEPGKFSVDSPGFGVSGNGSFFSGSERSNVDVAPIYSDRSLPNVVSLLEVNTDKSRCITGVNAGITFVFGSGADSQVRTPVVEGIPIAVIDLQARRGSHQEFLHLHDSVRAIIGTRLSGCVETARRGNPHRPPAYIPNKGYVGRIDNRSLHSHILPRVSLRPIGFQPR